MDPRTWGHQVGNKIMADLGRLARCWLDRLDDRVTAAALATFGGDEVVVIADVTDGPPFSDVIVDLAALLRMFLPVTVSFAHTVITPTALPKHITGDAWAQEWTAHVIGGVDRALFATKRARRDNNADVPLGFVIPA